MNKIKTKKLTEAALILDLIIIISIFAIYTPVLSSLYIDLIVPAFISIIYLRTNAKCTILSIIASIFIILVVIGQMSIIISLIQSMMIGFMCGFVISKKIQ